jgi:hypothetical protein
MESKQSLDWGVLQSLMDRVCLPTSQRLSRLITDVDDLSDWGEVGPAKEKTMMKEKTPTVSTSKIPYHHRSMSIQTFTTTH